RTTSSATSASSNARRTSRAAASTSAAVRAPRLVSRSRIPDSLLDRPSNISNTKFARGRTALSGVDLRSHGAGRRIVAALFESPADLWPTSPKVNRPLLLQGRAEFAKPAFLHLHLSALQDRNDPADPAGRQGTRRLCNAVLRVEM